MDKLVFSEQKGWKKKITQNKERKIYNFLNSHDLYQFVNEPLFKESVKGSENVNYIDGFIITAYFSTRKLRRIPRLSGPELMRDYFKDQKISKEKRHFFIGFDKGDLEKFSKKFPYLDRKDIFAYNPSYIKALKFPEEEISKISKLINSKRIDCVWVGVGSPKQNILAKEIFRKTNAQTFFNIGAALDFILGKKSRAPKWIQEIGFEWFYRMATDFNHSWKKVKKSFIANFYLMRYIELK